MQMKSERGNIRSSILAGDRKKNWIKRVAPIGQQVGLGFAWEPDVDCGSGVALHALSLCAPPGQSVSQPKHPDSKQCHILEILRRSSPPAGPQVSWLIKRGLGGCWTSPGDPGTHPGSPPGAGGVRVGECEIVVWVKWPLIVSGISGEVGPRWRTHGNPRHRTLCLDRHRQQLLFSQKIDIFFQRWIFFF